MVNPINLEINVKSFLAGTELTAKFAVPGSIEHNW